GRRRRSRHGSIAGFAFGHRCPHRPPITIGAHGSLMSSSQSSSATLVPAVNGELFGLRPHRERLYPLAATLVTAGALFVAFRRPWSADLGIHAATVERLRE